MHCPVVLIGAKGKNDQEEGSVYRTKILCRKNACMRAISANRKRNHETINTLKKAEENAVIKRKKKETPANMKVVKKCRTDKSSAFTIVCLIVLSNLAIKGKIYIVIMTDKIKIKVIVKCIMEDALLIFRFIVRSAYTIMERHHKIQLCLKLDLHA